MVVPLVFNFYISDNLAGVFVFGLHPSFFSLMGDVLLLVSERIRIRNNTLANALRLQYCIRKNKRVVDRHVAVTTRHPYSYPEAIQSYNGIIQ